MHYYFASHSWILKTHNTRLHLRTQKLTYQNKLAFMHAKLKTKNKKERYKSERKTNSITFANVNSKMTCLDWDSKSIVLVLQKRAFLLLGLFLLLLPLSYLLCRLISTLASLNSLFRLLTDLRIVNRKFSKTLVWLASYAESCAYPAFLLRGSSFFYTLFFVCS